MLHILHPGEPATWISPSDQDLADINTMRDNADSTQEDNAESTAWMKKTYGNWLGAQKID